MKNNIIILFLLILVFSFSCTDDFNEMNTDPAGVLENNNPALHLSELQFRAYTYGDLQTSTNLHHDQYAQYFSNTHSGLNSTPIYIANDGWLSNRWLRFYSIYYKLHKEILKTEEFNDINSNAANFSRIYFSSITANMTDTYGSMPFLTASNGDENQKFDSQEVIYNEILTTLKSAEENLIESDEQFNVGVYDIIYGGDVPSWKRFANSLRLRYAMRIVNVDPVKAKSEAEAAMAKDLIINNSQNALLGVDPLRSGWGAYGNQRRMIATWGRGGHIVMSKSLEKFYQS